MESKFTLRDFLVYLLTGFSLFIFLFSIHYLEIIGWIKNNETTLKDNGALIMIFFIVGGYVTGHIVQSIDAIRYMAAKLFKRFARTKSLFLKPFKWIFVLLAGDRVLGILVMNDKNIKDFWDKSYYIQIKDKYNPSEYWYIIKDLVNGLETTSILIFVYLFFIQTPNKSIYQMIYAFLSFLFWIKSRIYAAQYIESVTSTHRILKIEDRKRY